MLCGVNCLLLDLVSKKNSFIVVLSNKNTEAPYIKRGSSKSRKAYNYYSFLIYACSIIASYL